MSAVGETFTARPNPSSPDSSIRIPSLPSMIAPYSNSADALPDSASSHSVPVWNLPDHQSLPTTSPKLGSNVLRRSGLVLHLRATTWAADSHGLFDYESRSVHLKILKCNCFRDTYHVVRVGTDVQLLGEDQAEALYASEPRSKLLAQLSWSNGTYNLAPANSGSNIRPSNSPINQNERLWLVVRTLKDRGVALTQGDVIKLGRYRIRVKEVVLSPQEAKAMGSRRFLCQTEDEEDDCETVAPDSIDIPIVEGLGNSLHQQDLAAELRHDGIHQHPQEEPAVNLPFAVDRESLSNGSSSSGTLSRTSPPHLDLNLPALQPLDPPQPLHQISSFTFSSFEVPIKASAASSNEASPSISFVASRSITACPSEDFFRAKSSINTRICRICLCEADDDDIDSETNPLVAPCECKGSMKWVHLMCLRTWMAGRLNIRNDGSMVCFFWRSLECELCKVLYPPVVKIVDSNCISSSEDEGANIPGQQQNGNTDKDQSDPNVRYRRMSDSKAYYGKTPSLTSHHHHLKKSNSAQGYRTVELFELPRPEVPYIILEPRGQQSRGLHVVSLANNKAARLGRGHESDIRLADISVSRLHSILRFQSPPAKRSGSAVVLAGSGGTTSVSSSPYGCFVIEDNRSKFGTLVEIRKPFKLDPQCAVQTAFQAGRTVLTFTLKRRWRFMFPACLRNSHTDVSVLAQQAPTQPTPGQPSTFGGRTAESPSGNVHQPMAFGGGPLERDDSSSDEGDERESQHQSNHYNTPTVIFPRASSPQDDENHDVSSRELPERSERDIQIAEAPGNHGSIDVTPDAG